MQHILLSSNSEVKTIRPQALTESDHIDSKLKQLLGLVLYMTCNTNYTDTYLPIAFKCASVNGDMIVKD